MSSGEAVDEGVETGRVVVMDGVAQLVYHDVVAQVFGQRHEVKAQRYVVAPRTRTPLRAGGAYGHLAIAQAEAAG